MLPNLIIIGAMKAATTSLHRYLNLHPEISMSAEKEVNFFDREGNCTRNLAWYEQYFQEQPNVRIYGESSTNYTKYPFFPGIPERIHSVIPQAKLIYILRDPIERTISHYFMQYLRNERCSLNEIVADIESIYICTSRYYFQLEQYIPYFPLERIHILTSESLKNNAQATMTQVFRFLEVDDTFYTDRFQAHHNTSANTKGQNKLGRIAQHLILNAESPVRKVIMPLVPKQFRRNLRKNLFRTTAVEMQKPTISKEIRQKLHCYLQPDVSALRELIGIPFDEWSF
jgi:sulfotransferase family protein